MGVTQAHQKMAAGSPFSILYLSSILSSYLGKVYSRLVPCLPLETLPKRQAIPAAAAKSPDMMLMMLVGGAASSETPKPGHGPTSSRPLITRLQFGRYANRHVVRRESECMVRKNDSVRVALCFYGAVRQFDNTIDSIEQNLIAALRAKARVDVFIHAMLTDNITTDRSGEDGSTPLDTNDYKKLNACDATTSDQGLIDEEYRLHENAVAARQQNCTGDLLTENRAGRLNTNQETCYGTETIMNLMRSRFSIEAVGTLTRANERRRGFKYTHVVLARPDVSFRSPVEWNPAAVDPAIAHVWLPNVDLWGGACDRFASGTADAMLDVVMRQWTDQMEKGESNSWREQMLRGDGVKRKTSEQFFCDQLRTSPTLKVSMIPVCLVRIRSDGSVDSRDDRPENKAVETGMACLPEQFDASASSSMPPCGATSTWILNAQECAAGDRSALNADECVAAVQEAAQSAGVEVRSRSKTVDSAEVPPGCLYSPVSKMAIFSVNPAGRSSNTLYKWACLRTSVCDKPAPQNKDLALSAELYTINLEEDTDRKEHMEHQLALVGYDQARVHHFDGAKDARGAHRRTKSHMAVLEMVSQGDAPFAIVMEDDFTFFDTEQAALQLKRAMHLSIGWTVILLSCSNPEGVGSAAFNVSDDPRAASAVLSRFALTGEGDSCAAETLSDHFGTSVSCQGTSGYMIAKSYAPTLLARFEDAEASSQKSSSATDWTDTIDTIWKALQVRPPTATYAPSLLCALVLARSGSSLSQPTRS